MILNDINIAKDLINLSKLPKTQQSTFLHTAPFNAGGSEYFSTAGICFLDILQLPGWLTQYTRTSPCINCMYRVLRLGSHYRRLHFMQLGCGLIVL